MPDVDSKAPFFDDERHSLVESASLCEMIVEANPSDTGALETLKEIYTKLGDRERLGQVVARLATLAGGRPLASGSSSTSRSSSPRDSGGTPASGVPSDRRPGHVAGLGGRLVADGTNCGTRTQHGYEVPQ